MGVVKQLAKGRSESPRDKEGSGAVYWRFWLFFLRAEARTPAQGPWRRDPGWAGGRLLGGWAGGRHAGSRCTSHRWRILFFPLDDLFQWLIILTQTQDFNVWLFFFLMTHQ